MGGEWSVVHVRKLFVVNARRRLGKRHEFVSRFAPMSWLSAKTPSPRAQCTVTCRRLVRSANGAVAYFAVAPVRRTRYLITASRHMSEIRFRDRAGWQWEVVESSKRRVSEDAAEVQRALYFLNRYETRRIDEFPADWARRPSKELMKLCEVAEPL